MIDSIRLYWLRLRSGVSQRGIASHGFLPSRRWRHHAATVAAGCSLTYLGAVLCLWVFQCIAGDECWVGTILVYGPRWVWALPLVVLVPAVAIVHRRWLWLLLIALVLVIGPVMGFCLPWRTALARTAHGPRLRVLTCNVDGDHLDAAALSTLVTVTWPNVVALQEWPASSSPARVFWQKDWHVWKGKGLCLASRFPIRQVLTTTDEHAWRDVISRYDLETPDRVLHFFNLHLATPRWGLEAVLDRHWSGIPELEANIALRWHESEVARVQVDPVHGALVLAGDFNLPSDSAIYRQFWSRFSDAFSSAGLGFGHTKFTRWFGVRIDHVLTGPGWRPRRCWVGPDVGSDHRPVIADLAWIDTGR